MGVAKMSKLFVVTANTHQGGYGVKLNLFLVADNAEDANKEKERLSKKGYHPRISEVDLNSKENIYLGGYAE
jgi:hypothetical protein